MKIYYNNYRWIHEEEAKILAKWINKNVNDLLKSLLGEYKYIVVG